jgi:cell wall assembly regulator SMI1
MTAKIVTSWNRIHKALAAAGTEHLGSLAKPASEASIAKLEAVLDHTLPVEFKESLAIHDGQKPGAEVGEFPGFYSHNEGGSYYLMTSKAIARDWRMLRSVMKSGDFDGLVAEPDRGVRAHWWHVAWIPFASNGGGDHLCLDLDPATGGTKGQVICVMHDAPRRTVHSRSFVQWLQGRADAISAGKLPESELLSNVVCSRSRSGGGLADAVDELVSLKHVGDLLVALGPSPAFLGGLRPLEHHRQAGSPGAASLGPTMA